MKIDDYSVDIMCNTLNAIAGMVFLPKEPIPSASIRQDILDAQKMISVLYEENQKLKDKEPGRWIWVPFNPDSELGFWRCSNCGFAPAHFNMVHYHLKYCPECGKKMVSTPGVQFYESLGEMVFAECSDPPGDPWVYRTVEGLNAIRQTLDEKQGEQIWRAQKLISELYKENQKLKGENNGRT